MKHTSKNHYYVMFCIMLIAGFLSTMNIWADKYEDMRYSINDVYMVLLMTGWMFLLMGIYDMEKSIIGLGSLLVIATLWCIRSQFLVSDDQYKLGMIPHHSMAIHMSKKRLAKETRMPQFLANIIKNQEEEIVIMKGGKMQ
jgi:hypothetical protein